MSADFLEQLKVDHPKTWMIITNARGELVGKSLQKVCCKHHVPTVENDDSANLSALLEHLRAAASSAPVAAASSSTATLDEGQLRAVHAGLCRDADTGDQLPWDAWRKWSWLQERTGPAGSSALLTDAAVEDIWARVVVANGLAASGPDEFVQLFGVVKSECDRATTIQAVLRGRVGRRQADDAVRAGAEQANIIQEAPKLAPFNPTPDCAISQALDALQVGPGDLVYDLGCGDGRLLVAAAARRARALGVEYDERYVLRARERVAQAGVGDLVEVQHGDASCVDLAPATKIFVYLVPSGLQCVAPALQAALDRGVPVVSYTFSLPGTEPDKC